VREPEAKVHNFSLRNIARRDEEAKSGEQFLQLALPVDLELIVHLLEKEGISLAEIINGI
jgi:hypothetical protein